jgi:hypothetical protein
MSFPIPFIAFDPSNPNELFFYDPQSGASVVPVSTSGDLYTSVCGNRELVYSETSFAGLGATVSMRGVDGSGADRSKGVSIITPTTEQLRTDVVGSVNPTVVVSYRDSSFDPVLAVASAGQQTTYLGEYTTQLRAVMSDLSLLSAEFEVSI